MQNITKKMMPITTPKLKVLISGAGIAGPCFAYWLARAGPNASVKVIERSPVPRTTGQAIDIHGAAVKIAKKMNIEEAIRARTTTEAGTMLLNSSRKPFATFTVGDTFTSRYEILRADLSDLLLEASKTFDNINYKYGDFVQSLNQTETGVDVIFNGGSKETFDLVVGADGSTSKIRSMVLDKEALKDSYNFIGQYIAFFSIPSQPNDSKFWEIFNAPKGLCMMTRPHRNPSTKGVYLCITMPKHGIRDPVVEKAMEEGIEATKRMLHSYFENGGWEAKQILEGLDKSDDFYMTKAAQVKVPKWTNGRAVVIGDAAMATFGVGTTLAIDSAYILAGELSRIRSSAEIPEALQRYEKTFRPIYKTMEDLPPGFPQFAIPQTRWGMWIRDSIIWFICKTKVHKLFPEGGNTDHELPEYDWIKVETER
ncbi:uncharacterized protein EAF01_008040 [Botrytis porri]|uniref:FAD-binding domain-containing protein n=1 Tax=Botrytis porri TaxID=87229 RepID=A0A4Z1KX15_9HELO|nr:uncharacterized protein EAF01_008040 [Botrytis porri]KAF7898827.1 hypothetical protein EAF01_008040 [Botrytis porri]TGO88893.1 hypothetical protein BPOR_0136g00170 [Botrytis porri]